ncbi:MAG TPA: DUF423 domain-containing protein [Acidobacteriota bacterium]
MPKTFLLAGALFALFAVAAGAFGAHFLRSHLTPEMLGIFEIAVRYQMYHALALLAAGLALQRSDLRWLRYGGYSFIAGIIIFSGSLYLLSLTGTRQWGVATPFGGIAFLAGWLCLAAGFLSQDAPRHN